LNVILQKVAKDFLTELNLKKIVKEVIENSRKSIPDLIGEIEIEEFSIGKSIPKFFNISAEEKEENLIIELEVEYEDKEAKISLSTEVVLNEPLKHWASLPISVCIENLFLKSKLQIRASKKFKNIFITLLEYPEYDIVLNNQIGNRKMLKNVPKISEIINQVIHQILKDQLVFPNEIHLKDL
jgi:hypothetical protein